MNSETECEAECQTDTVGLLSVFMQEGGAEVGNRISYDFLNIAADIGQAVLGLELKQGLAAEPLPVKGLVHGGTKVSAVSHCLVTSTWKKRD